MDAILRTMKVRCVEAEKKNGEKEGMGFAWIMKGCLYAYCETFSFV